MARQTLTMKPNHGRPQTGFTVDGSGNKVYRLERGPQSWSDVQIPPNKTEKGVTKIHVDLFLKVSQTPIWERGGRKRFAQAKGLEFGTEKEFEELFKTY